MKLLWDLRGDYAQIPWDVYSGRLRWTERSCMSWQGRERKWNAGQGRLRFWT